MKMYQVDAFSQVQFRGNPAAVLILEEWLDDALMQNIAAENNLAETAFVKKIDQYNYAIRWFSPLVEVAFCGHATLASAFVLFQHCDVVGTVNFHVKNMGIFKVTQAEDGKIHMNFPIRAPHKLEQWPQGIEQAIDRPIQAVYLNEQAYILVCESEQDVREATPNLDVIRKLAGEQLYRTAITAQVQQSSESENQSKPSELLDLAITAQSVEQQSQNLALQAIGQTEVTDYVARYFAPHIGIDEDPVTGSLHTALAPFWAQQLNKTSLIAEQVSARSGKLYCKLIDDSRIEIAGYAVLYMQAELSL